MNCTNCGAPVELAEGKDYFYCRFCSTLKFPEKHTSTTFQDGVTPLGQDTDWDCPVCHGTLEHAVIEKTRVHYCAECRGVLADSDAFAAVVRSRRALYRGPDRVPTPLNPEDLAREVRCPVCRLPMDTHPYYGPGAVVIDSCCRCHVVWLDHCEIAAIESAPGRR